ncbi:hypothetical protein Pmani_021709 [Petrolisthes manimaculis]|uniref:RNA helicase n=1 Tax=Petrolisthes manimaculis TaxID=1843537 RepID=A0AAE1U1E3_9EUCA|nr:hypothetical protein Pmani_021709 [Petrolisthes manimaculis]
MRLMWNIIPELQHSRQLQRLFYIQKRCSSVEQFSVIRMPVETAKQLERLKFKVKKAERMQLVQNSRKGDCTVPVISCKRKEYNHYLGQSYNKFTEVPLASKGWQHLKAVGDYFTINSHAKNPSVEGSEEDHLCFESLGLKKDLLTEIYKLDFEKPTNIQALAIPHVLEGKNTFITAETGNGKTLAFLAPILQQIAKLKISMGSELPFNSPLGLVIVPSRELAEQIFDVARRLGDNLGISVQVLVGGKTKKKMLHPELAQQDLLIATVGALSKLTTVRVWNTDYLRHVVMDEADTLLDDSFSEKVLHFISKLPVQGANEETQQPEILSGVQLTLVAATMPRSLHTILHPLLNLESLVHLTTPHVNRFMPHVPQRFIRVNRNTKTDQLMKLVSRDVKRNIPIVIFCNDSKTSDWISLFLNENNISCINLNGAMKAVLRKGRFEAFQEGKAAVLSCTDIASRGLDTVKAGHVINYNFPSYIADYIHRCGRIGRVGSKVPGVVTNLVHFPNEVELVQRIEYAVRKNEPFHNVNANITRIITNKIEKKLEVKMSE